VSKVRSGRIVEVNKYEQQKQMGQSGPIEKDRSSWVAKAQSHFSATSYLRGYKSTVAGTDARLRIYRDRNVHMRGPSIYTGIGFSDSRSCDGFFMPGSFGQSDNALTHTCPGEGTLRWIKFNWSSR
jgi:hypothetical protein